jgi:hypothetical protein
VSTLHHPAIVITSNGERAFSEAFLRRCVRLDLGQPDRDRLRMIVKAQLGDELPGEAVAGAVERYGDQTTDVLLQGLFLEHVFGMPPGDVAPAVRRDR